MLQKILLLITIVFLSFFNAFAQDVTVKVTDIVKDLDGNIIPGEIRIEFNPNLVLPIDLLCFTDPCGNNNCDDVGSHTFIIGTSGCNVEGEWCFTITENLMNMDCTIDFCVRMRVCEEFKRTTQDGLEVIMTNCSEPSKPNNDKIQTNILDDVISSHEQIMNKVKNDSANLSDEIPKIGDKVKQLNLKKIYPNPFNDRLEIELKSTENAEISVFLMDFLGRTVLNNNFSLTQGENSFSMNPDENLPKGTYILLIKSDSGQVITEKVVKVN